MVRCCSYNPNDIETDLPSIFRLFGIDSIIFNEDEREKKKMNKKAKRFCGILIDARSERVHLRDAREISRSSLRSGDAVGPTGSPDGPSVSFGCAGGATPSVSNRGSSQIFGELRSPTNGLPRVLPGARHIAQCTAWQPGPRATLQPRSRDATGRVDAVACVPSRTHTHTRTRSLARSDRAPFCVFWNAHTASASASARGTWSSCLPTRSTTDLVRGRLSARGGLISSTSAARARHATAQSENAGKGGWGEGVS